MRPDEVELRALRRYTAQHKTAELADADGADKCSRELDLRTVLREIGCYSENEIEYQARFWLNRLAPENVDGAPLRRCSNSRLSNDKHKYHARAYLESPRAPAWDRIDVLEARAPSEPTRLLEPKFGLLGRWPQQAVVDFAIWVKDSGGAPGYEVAALFLDIDDFKQLNQRHTESVVDARILGPFQEILRAAALHRGEAYRHGGEEFVLLFPNQSVSEAVSLAEKLRAKVQGTSFSLPGAAVSVTVSIGVAVYPQDGANLDEVVQAANRRERLAKHSGKDSIRDRD